MKPTLPFSETAAYLANQDVTIRVRVGSSIADAERRLILATLRQVNGNKRDAAQMLGVSVKTLYNRLSQYQAAGVSLDTIPYSPRGSSRSEESEE